MVVQLRLQQGRFGLGGFGLGLGDGLQVPELALLAGLDAEPGFDEALRLWHGVAELLFGHQLLPPDTGILSGGLVVGDLLAQPGQLGLVGVLGAVSGLGVGGFGAFGLLAGQPPHLRAAQLLLEVGGLAGQLGRLGVCSLFRGFVLGGLGLELLAAPGLPPAGSLGLAGAGVGVGSGIAGCGGDLPPAAQDLLHLPVQLGAVAVVLHRRVHLPHPPTLTGGHGRFPLGQLAAGLLGGGGLAGLAAFGVSDRAAELAGCCRGWRCSRSRCGCWAGSSRGGR